MTIKRFLQQFNISVFIGLFCFSAVFSYAQDIKIEPKIAITINNDKDKKVGGNLDSNEKSKKFVGRLGSLLLAMPSAKVKQRRHCDTLKCFRFKLVLLFGRDSNSRQHNMGV